MNATLTAESIAPLAAEVTAAEAARAESVALALEGHALECEEEERRADLALARVEAAAARCVAALERTRARRGRAAARLAEAAAYVAEAAAALAAEPPAAAGGETAPEAAPAPAVTRTHSANGSLLPPRLAGIGSVPYVGFGMPGLDEPAPPAVEGKPATADESAAAAVLNDPEPEFVRAVAEEIAALALDAGGSRREEGGPPAEPKKARKRR